MSDHAHADFANVVRVPRFHTKPPRPQPRGAGAAPATVIILPVVRIARASAPCPDPTRPERTTP